MLHNTYRHVFLDGLAMRQPHVDKPHALHNQLRQRQRLLTWKGQMGSWRDETSDELAATLCAAHAGVMGRFGYLG